MDELEVYFCDLCNTSVPVGALRDGTARRHGDKVVGPCCLAALTGAAAARPAAGAPRDAGGSRSGVAVGAVVVVLAAVAGAAMFVDWRLSEEARQLDGSVRSLAGSLTRSEDQIVQLTQRIADTAARGDLASVSAAIADLRGVVETGDETLRVRVESGESRVVELRDALRAAHESSLQQAARLAMLHDEVRSLGRDIAELRAAPRVAVPARPDPMADPTPPAATEPDPATTLPATLMHYVARLSDRDDGTRFEAVDELLESKDPRVFVHLVPLATDPDPFVRRLVLEGIANHRSVDTVEALLTALADPEGIVRHTAFESLKKVTGQSLPFDPDGSADQRAAMQRRWRQWWDKNRDSIGAAVR